MESCGGVTQISYVVASVTSFFAILFLSDFANHLPHCIVAAILFVAFLRGVTNLRKLPKYWRQDKSYVLISTFTFVIGITISFSACITYGLLFSIVIAVLRTAFPSVTELQYISTGSHRHWVDVKNYKDARPYSNTVVIAIRGPSFFASFERIQESVFRILKRSQDDQVDVPASVVTVSNGIGNKHQNHPTKTLPVDNESSDLWHVVLDFSGVSYTDVAGLRMLTNIKKQLASNHRSTLCLAACPETVKAALSRAPSVVQKLEDHMYATINDAVIACQHHTLKDENSSKDGGGMEVEWEDGDHFTVL